MTAGDYFRLVKFSHSIFALPFALASAWLASGGLPPLRTLALIVLCAVAARTAAMGFNRLVDHKLDAANPRTAGRELPAGVLSPLAVSVFILVSTSIFVLGAWALSPLCASLSPIVLLVLFGYSYAKRFTYFAHLILGLALGLAPLGAWLAVRGNFEGDLWPPILLAAAVTLWVAGFDLIYACQDAQFDRERGLHSIPARFGLERALWLSRMLHAATATLLVAFGLRAELGAAWWIGVLLSGALFIWQHRLVSARDLARVDMAFFTLNGWIGVGLLAGLVADLSLFGGQV